MSEYFTLETETTDDPNVLEITVNQTLTDSAPEVYAGFDEGDVGSPIAQMLFSGVRGLHALTITKHSLLVTRDPEVSWEEIVDEVRDALRDFFL
jgi:Scaffold protein Nfu/NifU N terminal